MEKQLAFSKTFSLFSQRNFIVASIDVRGSGFQGDEFKHTVFRSPSLHQCHHQWHHRHHHHHQFYIVVTIAIIIRCWRVQAPSLQISSWYNHHCNCQDHNEMFLQAAWDCWGPRYSVCDQVRSSLISWSLRHQKMKASKFNFHLQNFHFPKVFMVFPKF